MAASVYRAAGDLEANRHSRVARASHFDFVERTMTLDAREIAERAVQEIVWEKAYTSLIGSSRWFAELWEFAAEQIEAALLSHGDAKIEEAAKVANLVAFEARGKVRNARGPVFRTAALAAEDTAKKIEAGIRRLKSAR